ncbi:hypothetical protein ACQR1Y_11620 [Bradyrhizobium sp. HKCCYLRH3099]
MSILAEEEVVRIARAAGEANNLSITAVSTAPAVDSTGTSAIDIKIVLTPGSSASIMGLPSANTTSQIIRQIADEGDERFPIIRFEEQGAA